ncbi:hypothetical protein CAR_c13230 [Carnobacterium sp. 17-4]|uniref:hypothetical protein n=1 Tax=Carnobacterium sp. (strain 17-4) TaxID=208596 RepID=UPI0002058828|nr:hypothetical protein [Carnobacterium sp. 17-4]AEB30014.1 hypothetical protein CAR_c13230 [Carnobacterium sp. 17-4]
MDKSEVHLSNGKTVTFNSSAEQLLNKVTDEDGELLESFVLLEDEKGISCYLNPSQIVTISVLKSNTNEEKSDSKGKHTKENLDAISNLSKDIGNME